MPKICASSSFEAVAIARDPASALIPGFHFEVFLASKLETLRGATHAETMPFVWAGWAPLSQEGLKVTHDDEGNPLTWYLDTKHRIPKFEEKPDAYTINDI